MTEKAGKSADSSSLSLGLGAVRLKCSGQGGVVEAAEVKIRDRLKTALKAKRHTETMLKRILPIN